MEKAFGSHGFERSIDAVDVRKIGFDAEAEVLDRLERSLRSANVLMLGEMHGVAENPAIIRTVMETFGIRRLALEWDATLADVAERFLATGHLDLNGLEEHTDGRVTSGHYAMLRDMTRDGLLDGFVCMDRRIGGDWQDRDRTMADEVLKSPGPLLVVAGNLHTRLDPFRLDDDFKHFVPMGAIVKSARPDTATITIDYGSGHFANLGVKPFDDTRHGDRAKLTREIDDEYAFYVPVAHAAEVPA